MQLLDQAVAEEDRGMARVVRLLNRDSAARWLSGFISERPWSCPSAEQAQWIEAIIHAVERNGVTLCKEILGLVACVISIESGFRMDPLAVDPGGGENMADLLKRGEQELQQKTGGLLAVPPLSTLYARYKDRFYPSLLACRTEGDVEQIARAIAESLKKDASQLPEFLRTRIYEGIDKLAHVVRTKGSMQLSFNRARRVMKDRGEEFTDEALSEYIYTLKGGVDVGVAALKPMFVQYGAYYATPGDLSWLFFVGMDYHYGPFSSRNMMEQIRIRDLSGRDIPLDGDLLLYDKDAKPLKDNSMTLDAAAAFLTSVPGEAIFKAFVLEKAPHYIYTDVHQWLSRAHRAGFGDTPFAVIGELWMGQAARIKHGALWKTRAYLNKLDRYLNSVPWELDPGQ